jgi:hypothetical protein
LDQTFAEEDINSLAGLIREEQTAALLVVVQPADFVENRIR